jgi:hypothetical protein
VHHRLRFSASIFAVGRGSLIPAQVFSTESCFPLRFSTADLPRSFSRSIGVPAAEVPCFPLRFLGTTGQIPVFFPLQAEEHLVFPLVSSDPAVQDLVSRANPSERLELSLLVQGLWSARRFFCSFFPAHSFPSPVPLGPVSSVCARFYVLVSTGAMQ